MCQSYDDIHYRKVKMGQEAGISLNPTSIVQSSQYHVIQSKPNYRSVLCRQQRMMHSTAMIVGCTFLFVYYRNLKKVTVIAGFFCPKLWIQWHHKKAFNSVFELFAPRTEQKHIDSPDDTWVGCGISKICQGNMSCTITKWLEPRSVSTMKDGSIVLCSQGHILTTASDSLQETTAHWTWLPLMILCLLLPCLTVLGWHQ